MNESTGDAVVHGQLKFLPRRKPLRTVSDVGENDGLLLQQIVQGHGLRRPPEHSEPDRQEVARPGKGWAASAAAPVLERMLPL